MAELIKDYEEEIGEFRFHQSASPKIRWFFDQTTEQHKHLDGPVGAPQRAFASPAAATTYIKETARNFGADAVGIAALDSAFVYRGRQCPHRYAISLAMKMDPGRLKDIPFAANYASAQVYYELGRVTVELAAHVRGLGYPARAHHPHSPKGPEGASLVNHLPIAWQAGLGELGRHGSLISPVLGAWFRLSTVTTDLPLQPDSPLAGEIVDFCQSCTVCAEHCPGGAISHGPLMIANGVVRWVVDTEKCVPYFRDLGSCAICIQVCPWNGKALDGILRREWLEDTRRWRDLKGEAYRTLPVLQSQPNS